MGWLGLAGLPDCAHGRALFSWYVLLLMALYVPAGWVVSRLRGWPRPDRKTGCKAVLYPALCAWGWAFGGCGLLLLFSGREALFPLAFTGFALLAFSFLLASPSALFMLLTLDLLSGSLRDAGVCLEGFRRNRANRLHSRQAEEKLWPVKSQHRGLTDMSRATPARQLSRMAR